MRISMLATAVWMAAASAASAAVIRVPDDFPTIFMAVDSAAAGDSVLVGAGTWADMDTRLLQLGAGDPTAVTAAAFVNRSMTILAEQGAAVTIVDGGPSGGADVMAFTVVNHPNVELTVEGFTITACNRHAVFGWDCKKVTVRSCILVENSFSTSLGSAVRAFRCDVTVLDSAVSFNSQPAPGAPAAGILATFSARVIVRRDRFEGNEGRAVVASGIGTNDVVIADCEFIRNRCADGGAGALLAVPDPLVERNLFLQNVATSGAGGALLVSTPNGAIRFNTFAFDSCLGVSSAGGGAAFSSGFDGIVSNNTFYGCYAPAVGAAVWVVSSDLRFQNNVVASSDGSAALGAALSTVTSGCNVLWDNAFGDYWQWPTAPTDLSVDPRFCDPGVLDLTVRSDSPCVEGNTPGCAGIGAWGEGCGLVSVDTASWGKIKSLYR